MVTDSLIQAVRSGNLQTTRELLQGKEDIDVNARYDYCKQTLLHHASANGELEIVKYLIQEKNANVNSVDYDGWTPLFRICKPNKWKTTEEERAKVAQFLLTNGADVNTRTSTNSTALHQVCLWESTVFIQLLLSHGANINSADEDGETPLYYACKHNPQMDVVKLLLANNANRHTKNHLGRGPMDLLGDRGHEEVFECYHKWPLAVDNMQATPTKKVSTVRLYIYAILFVARLNVCLATRAY